MAECAPGTSAIFILRPEPADEGGRRGTPVTPLCWLKREFCSRLPSIFWLLTSAL
jgi:hypothetical protein